MRFPTRPVPTSSRSIKGKNPKRVWLLALSIFLVFALSIATWAISNRNSSQLAQTLEEWNVAMDADNQTHKTANTAGNYARHLYSRSDGKVLDNKNRFDLEESLTQLTVLYDSSPKQPRADNRGELESSTAALNQRTSDAEALITKVEADTAAVQLALDDYLLGEARDTNTEIRNAQTALINEARAAIKEYAGKIATSTTDGKRQNILETLAKEIESAERNLNVPVDRDSITELNLNTPTLSNPLLRPYLQDAHRSHEKWQEQQTQP